MLPQVQKFVHMFDEFNSGAGREADLGGVDAAPVLLQLLAVPVFVLPGYLHQFGVVAAVFVVFVGVGVDEVGGVEFYEVLYFVFDYAGVVAHYSVDFACAVLEEAFAVRVGYF